jgi:hypothetical protein
VSHCVARDGPAGAGSRRGRVRDARWRLAAAAAALWAVAAGAGCGKKGPPLPPLVSLPAAVQDLAVQRVGSQVFVRFTVPAANTDGTRPADLARVDVFAYTGPTPSAQEAVQSGALAVSLPVRPPAREDEGTPRPRPSVPGLDQGAPATWSAALEADALEAAPVAPTAPDAAATADAADAPAPGRFYVAVGVNRSGRRGELSPAVGVLLGPAPNAPAGVGVAYGPGSVTVRWATGEPQADRFNVFEVQRGNAAAPADRVPLPLNAEPVSGGSFEDPRVAFGAERCYAVRRVRVAGDLAAESEPSAPACVTPVDTFAPAAPRSLAAVSSENAVNLIWEANAESDLAGYLVLRGEAPGETLAPITPAPIRETTYRDTAARRGVTYVYAVEAVDTATPPNVSDPSNRVQEAIR